MKRRITGSCSSAIAASGGRPSTGSTGRVRVAGDIILDPPLQTRQIGVAEDVDDEKAAEARLRTATGPGAVAVGVAAVALLADVALRDTGSSLDAALQRFRDGCLAAPRE